MRFCLCTLSNLHDVLSVSFWNEIFIVCAVFFSRECLFLLKYFCFFVCIFSLPESSLACIQCPAQYNIVGVTTASKRCAGGEHHKVVAYASLYTADVGLHDVWRWKRRLHASTPRGLRNTQRCVRSCLRKLAVRLSAAHDHAWHLPSVVVASLVLWCPEPLHACDSVHAHISNCTINKHRAEDGTAVHVGRTSNV